MIGPAEPGCAPGDDAQIDVALFRPPHAYRVPLLKKGAEEWESLNMVPVRVRDEQIDLGRRSHTCEQFLPENANAGSRVENHHASVLRVGVLDRYTRRVAPIPSRVGTWSGDRAARTPDRQRIRHRSIPAPNRENVDGTRATGWGGASRHTGDLPHERPANRLSAGRS